MAAELKQRSDLGHFLNQLALTGRGAEIGVYRGEFSREVLSQWRGREWNLIDPWRLTPEFCILQGGVAWDMEAAFVSVQQLAREEPRVKLHRIASTDWQDTELFDVVYVDGAHDYISVHNDLHHWWDRVRPGGLFCGHDYLDAWRWSNDINRGGLFGVRTAVDRFALHQGRAVVGTREDFPSWWFLKPLSAIEPNEITVASMSTGDLPWAEVTAENHQRYCHRWGHRYLHVHLENENRPVSWAKLRIVSEALKTARFVLWLDADALFQRFDLGLHRFWDGVSPFVFFKDDINGLNAGVFFARQCPEAQAFLARWDNMTEFNDHIWWDNGAILELERCGELIGLVMPHRLANSYPHLPGCWDSQDFIAHFTGLLPPIRTALIRDFASRAMD
jgi:hypothetical protein